MPLPRPRVARPHTARGFTLLELLVVVLVLAALGGAAIVAAGNLRDGALRQTAQMEMQKIKQALLQYRQDTGNFPAPANPADFSALYDTTQTWDPSTGRGLRGPYLSAGGEGLVDIGDGIANDGSGNPTVIITSARNEQRGVADPFAALPVRNGGYAACDDGEPDSACLLDWRSVSAQARHTRWGRPYLLFDLGDPARARLVSMGLDGRYAGPNTAEYCAAPADSDDLVLCLQR